MELIKEIFANEVFPALGCTEPISCAYTCAAAVEQLGAPLEKLELTVDPGTFKNGAAVAIPNSGGLRGNVIAAAMGALIARSELRLQILSAAAPEIRAKARAYIDEGRLAYRCSDAGQGLRIEAVARDGRSCVRCVVAEGHTNIVALEKDGVSILAAHPHAGGGSTRYRERLQAMKLQDVLHEVVALDADARAYIRHGIAMNLTIAEKGTALQRNAYQLRLLMEQGLMADDLFYRVKQTVAAALDARMAGLAEPVMTSGGSGNQGVLTFLLPYIVGRHRGIEPARVEESIAISHAVNSYIKSFTGELSVVCGCAIAASIAAAAAVVYQHAGIDMQKITFAVNNIIADLSGVICDGAKEGCSMKIVTGADTSLRSAFMALGGYGISTGDGIIGTSAEASIKNLSKIALEGMDLVDSAVVHILKEKAPRSGQA